VYFYYSNNDTSEINHEALGKSIDFESDLINHCRDATFDDETDNYDDARDLTDDMLQMNGNTFTFLSSIAQKFPPKHFK
jgi:hypothetical protein